MEKLLGWNLINVMFVFVNSYIAITCFKDGRDFAGHVNMAAVVVNALCIYSVVIS